jgi:hypothetical protein
MFFFSNLSTIHIIKLQLERLPIIVDKINHPNKSTNLHSIIKLKDKTQLKFNCFNGIVIFIILVK